MSRKLRSQLSIRLGETAKYVRQAKKLTQREAGARIGISHVHLSNIETGKAEPSCATLEAMNAVYSVDLAALSWCLHNDASLYSHTIAELMIALSAAWRKEIEQCHTSA